MRMNGGIIGKLNKPSNYSANGVWKWSERYANILDYRFPTYYPGFDLSNIISKQTQYTNKSFLVSSQEANPSALFFKPDGTKLYVTGSSSDNVHQYSLSTAWDTSTASYDNIKIAIAAQETVSTGLFFKSDGTKMYIVGSSSDSVYQYSLSTAWNVATVTYDSVNFSVGAQDTVPEDVFFKSDGTKMYILGSTNDRVFQYSLSSAWVVSSASYDNISYSIAAQDTSPSGLYFKDDGTKMYVVGNFSDTIYQYSLATAWNVATASVDSVAYNSLSIVDYDIAGTGLFFKPDGTKLYFTGDTNNRIYEFDVGDPWNIQKYPGYNGVYFSVTVQETNATGISFKPDGTKMYIVGTSSDRVQQYALSTPWNLTTASYEANVSIVGQSTTSQAIHFKSDGTKMYVTDGGFIAFQYTLATPWSITSATYDSVSYDFGSGNGPSIVFKSDGTKIYVGGETITQYTASSAWSIASPVSDSKSYSIISNTGPHSETAIEDFFISPDGSKLWAVGSASDRIYQYTFGTSWDISTLSYSKSYYIKDFDNTPTGIHFKPNGEKLFLLVAGNDIVYELNMTA